MTDAGGHRSQIGATPWPGVQVVRTRSGHRFPKHWHDWYGLGLMESGAHRSASGRGPVDAFAGDVIASNPGEVHDGRPLGVETRTWRMLSIEPPALAEATGAAACNAEITQPVIRDPLAPHARRRTGGAVHRGRQHRRPAAVRRGGFRRTMIEMTRELDRGPPGRG